MEGQSQTLESSSDEEDTKDEGNDEDTTTSVNLPIGSKVKVKNLQKSKMVRKMIIKKTLMKETLSSIRLRETRRYHPKREEYLPKRTKMADKTILTSFRLVLQSRFTVFKM